MDNASRRTRQEIMKRMTSFDKEHATAFAATCAERLLPNYGVFQDLVGWGNYSVLREALDEVWKYLSGAGVPDNRFHAIRDLCSSVTPDTAEFTTLWASHALDAGAAIWETISLRVDGKVEHAGNAATSAIDTVDMFIQERDRLSYGDPQFELKIYSDPLMIRELRNQLEDADLLQRTPVLSGSFLKSLRSKYEGRSNLR